MSLALGYKIAIGGVICVGFIMWVTGEAQASEALPDERRPQRDPDPEPAPQIPPPTPFNPSGVTVRPLDAWEKAFLAPYIPKVDLDNAVLHIGDMPFYSNMVINASAITRGNDIYIKDQLTFRDADSLDTLAHELVHVGQYRNGMNWATYLASAIPGGYSRSNVYEAPAYAMGDRVMAIARVMGL